MGHKTRWVICWLKHTYRFLTDISHLCPDSTLQKHITCVFPLFSKMFSFPFFLLFFLISLASLSHSMSSCPSLWPRTHALQNSDSLVSEALCFFSCLFYVCSTRMWAIFLYVCFSQLRKERVTLYGLWLGDRNSIAVCSLFSVTHLLRALNCYVKSPPWGYRKIPTIFLMGL